MKMVSASQRRTRRMSPGSSRIGPRTGNLLHVAAVSATIAHATLSNVPGGAEAFEAKLSPPWTADPRNENRRDRRNLDFIVHDDGGAGGRWTRRKRRPSSSSASSAMERDEAEDDDDDDASSAIAREERAYHHHAAQFRAAAEISALRQRRHRALVSSSYGRSSTSLGASPADASNEEGGSSPDRPAETVRSCLGQLLRMTRPSNFPGVVLFHLLGVHRALSAAAVAAAASGTAATSTQPTLPSVILRPQMIVVLVTLFLVSATSMVVNDYYDARSGVDARNVLTRALAGQSSDSQLDRPLATGAVPMPVAKRFLSYLYAALLLCLTAVPGIPARLTVVVATMLTFWYTQHLKPRTWLKNVSCAAIIALSPFTSGSAALAAVPGDSAVGGGSSLRLAFGALSRLVLTLFAGFMSRELLMDINDVEGDREASVLTVPVKYGRRFASRVALAFAAVMGTFAAGGPAMGIASSWDGALQQAALARGGTSTGGIGGVGSAALYASAIGALARTGAARKFFLAVCGSGLILRRAVQVARAEGGDLDLTARAIKEQKDISLLFILASFV